MNQESLANWFASAVNPALVRTGRMKTINDNPFGHPNGEMVIDPDLHGPIQNCWANLAAVAA